MLSAETINNLIGIDESYKVPIKLQTILNDSNKRVELFNQFLEEENDLSFDWFTDYFQEEHSDRKSKKQDFTPDGIVKLVSSLLGNFKINADICAGTGGLTIKRWSENHNGKFYCEEFSDRAMPFLLFNLMIRNIDAVVFHGDSLSRSVKYIYKLTKGVKFSSLEEIKEQSAVKADTVIMNPPYSLKWNPQKSMLDEPRFKDFKVLAPKSKADYAFILTGLDDLSDDGTMAIILPHGVLFRGNAEGKLRQRIIDLNYLDTVIGLPEKTFLNTDIPTVVLIFKKERQNRDVLFIDASKEFTKDKAHNRIEDKHISKIISTYHNRNDVDKFAHVATFDEIKENDYNLNIPRYVDTFEPEPVKPLHEIMAEMKELDAEIEYTSQELSVMLQELHGTNPEADKEIKEFTKYWVDKYEIGKPQRKEQLTLL
ncbi:N-6 DNA methylase [Limosilactobacillus fastidiosus]|uniref:site-specific DNA-methyltransferase (adenine-specific) n=1 Tax=Limosilactobacillus fastidiosus TaxID=2759855 RepID=A0A7W3YCJ8_9LACO|nr:N-6 DNA methylase [Limosilactobacillus fastidiosus]MBB1086388.1 N-6 DNA methylase [Limosilactobacillus fastidiosus]MCD7086237.1 SAM-dependent methyltransferase [Limosilactobacillus fastidiosus]MCD7115000.1 SAM-dependent methyltransferase [Limosilactobacillus fastidiosus]MCD7116837.1 SAM-dependent methyltransferase [Limosilactobacillus fastidiosus]